MYGTARPLLSRTSRRGIAGTTKNDTGSITISDHSNPSRQLLSVAYHAELTRSVGRRSFSTAFDGEYGFVIVVVCTTMLRVQSTNGGRNRAAATNVNSNSALSAALVHGFVLFS